MAPTRSTYAITYDDLLKSSNNMQLTKEEKTGAGISWLIFTILLCILIMAVRADNQQHYKDDITPVSGLIMGGDVPPVTSVPTPIIVVPDNVNNTIVNNNTNNITINNDNEPITAPATTVDDNETNENEGSDKEEELATSNDKDQTTTTTTPIESE